MGFVSKYKGKEVEALLDRVSSGETYVFDIKTEEDVYTYNAEEFNKILNSKYILARFTTGGADYIVVSPDNIRYEATDGVIDAITLSFTNTESVVLDSFLVIIYNDGTYEIIYTADGIDETETFEIPIEINLNIGEYKFASISQFNKIKDTNVIVIQYRSADDLCYLIPYYKNIYSDETASYIELRSKNIFGSEYVVTFELKNGTEDVRYTVAKKSDVYTFYYENEKNVDESEFEALWQAEKVIINYGNGILLYPFAKQNLIENGEKSITLRGDGERLTGYDSYFNLYIGIGYAELELLSFPQSDWNEENTDNPAHIRHKPNLASVATSGSYEDLSDKPLIPSAVTEATVSGWGFTKNKGTYTKPNGGIPKADLSSDVQTSLEKANTALQSEQYKGTVTAVKMNGSTKSPSNGVVDLGNVVTDVSGKQDKLVSGTNVKTINGVSILGSGNITIATGVDSNYVNDAITNAVTNALNTAV